MTPEELLSEVWQKLLGTMAAPSEEGSSVPDPTQASIDADAPERDGRVVWLIDQLGGSAAIAHRREDILRRRFGRASKGNGRPLVQPPSNGEFPEIKSDANATSALEAADGQRVWRGLLATAELEFGRAMTFRSCSECWRNTQRPCRIPQADNGPSRNWSCNSTIAFRPAHGRAIAWTTQKDDC